MDREPIQAGYIALSEAVASRGRAASVGANVFMSHVEHAVRRQARTDTTAALLLVRIENLTVLATEPGEGEYRVELATAGLERVAASLREVDTVALIRDDVIGVLVECDATTPTAEAVAGEVASRAVSAFVEPLRAPGVAGHVQVRTGIAVLEPSIAHAGELMSRAEVALAHCHEPGSFRFFDDAHQAVAAARLALKADLAGAIDRRELSLRYQPLVSLETGLPVAVEALLRWTRRERGEVPPSEFIPLAEETNLIVPLGDWVLEEALTQYAAWRASVPGLPVLGLDLNVSARQLCRPGFAAFVEGLLRDHETEPALLLLDLKESALAAHDDVATAQIEALRQIGVRFALDDFGTGYSSLEHLTTLPVDVVKIARVFVDRLGKSPQANALVRAIIDLAHSLGLITVAEGVERAEQAERLTQMGCYLGQGWHFARELDRDEAARALQSIGFASPAEPPAAPASHSRSTTLVLAAEPGAS